MLAQVDGVTPFKSTLSHPFSERSQQQIVDPVIRDNRDYYTHHHAGLQVGTGIATSAFQTAMMALSGTADMVGAALTERPDMSTTGLFADTMNMVFSIGTRAAKMTTQGVAGDSVFDRTLSVANLVTEFALAGESLRGAGLGVVAMGRHLNAAVRTLSQTLDHLTPAPALALIDGGLMMAADTDHAIVPASSGDALATRGGKVIEAELDHAAQSRKAALDEALQVPVPSMRANALTGTLELLAQACDWDDFVYAAGHAFDAIAEVGDKKAALQLRQNLAAEMANLMPDDAKLMPNAKVRGQLKALIERELPDAGRNAQLSRLLQAVQDKLAGWERVARERTPDRPLPVIRNEQPRTMSRRGFMGLAGLGILGVGLATYFATNDSNPTPGRTPTPEDFLAIGPCRHGFAYIPAGSFTMGSSSGGSDQLPVHKVELDAYCIARTETTNQSYLNLMGEASFVGPRLPVVNVKWQEAQDYCKKIGGSLPTEAQWEKAAKGPKGHPYGTHSGALNKNEANYDSTASVAVGSYPPNGYGLYDMTGNVAEWIQDWYWDEAYASHTPKNPTGPESGTHKVIRGGDWMIGAGNLNNPFLNTSIRHANKPDRDHSSKGFRCVVPPKDSKK